MSFDGYHVEGPGTISHFATVGYDDRPEVAVELLRGEVASSLPGDYRTRSELDAPSRPSRRVMRRCRAPYRPLATRSQSIPHLDRRIGRGELRLYPWVKINPPAMEQVESSGVPRQNRVDLRSAPMAAFNRSPDLLLPRLPVTGHRSSRVGEGDGVLEVHFREDAHRGARLVEHPPKVPI